MPDDYHRELPAEMQEDLAAALGYDGWAEVPQPVRNNCRAPETDLESVLEGEV